MPLSSPVAREPLTRRTITCEGFSRADGLLEIEGHLVDQRSYDMTNEWRGTVKAGSPVHDMWVRLTFDDKLVIRAVESTTDAAPYPSCREVTPNLQRLVGLGIAGGFKHEMRSRVGHTEGCTHIVALLEVLAGVAVQTHAGSRIKAGSGDALQAFGARDRTKPPLIGSCHSYAADGPIVRRLWPEHYRPRPDRGEPE
jgi:DUF2889 family protein